MKSRILCLTVSLLLLLLAGTSAEALFLKPELEKWPVDKLIKNLETQAEKEKKNVPIRYNLARVHAMAYALKIDTVEVTKKKFSDKKSDEGGGGDKKFGDKGKGGDKKGSGGGPTTNSGSTPWFGFTPAYIPFKAVKTKDETKLKTAKMHLEKAIETYRGIVKDDMAHLGAQLGLAWCIDQSGDKDEAIKAYRDVIKNGWDKERLLKSGPLGGNFITKEAAGYLIPLLDPTIDTEEIDSLRSRVALLNKLPRPVTPIAVPLRDGLTASDLEDRNASVLFDADGTGPKRWTWISQHAAWLVYDPTASRKIDSGLQLFGNVTFWCFWDNGYGALRALDDNADGMLAGNELAGLALWQDKNGDGISDPNEIQPLSYYDIVGVSCDWRADSHAADV
jgi:hypothetical protein